MVLPPVLHSPLVMLWLGLDHLIWGLCFLPDFKVSNTFRSSSLAPEGKPEFCLSYLLRGLAQ